MRESLHNQLFNIKMRRILAKRFAPSRGVFQSIIDGKAVCNDISPAMKTFIESLPSRNGVDNAKDVELFEELKKKALMK